MLVVRPARRSISPGHSRQVGLTMVEIAIALALLSTLMVVASKTFVECARATTSLSKLVYAKTQVNVLMDRLVEELLTGTFTSVASSTPTTSTSVSFQKCIGVNSGVPTLGNPVFVDSVAQESDVTNGIDDNGNGLIDETGLRIWEDFAPQGTAPGVEDTSTVFNTHLTPGGLSFTRQGSTLQIDLTIQEVLQPGETPTTVHLATNVKMRNP